MAYEYLKGYIAAKLDAFRRRASVENAVEIEDVETKFQELCAEVEANGAEDAASVDPEPSALAIPDYSGCKSLAEALAALQDANAGRTVSEILGVSQLSFKSWKSVCARIRASRSRSKYRSKQRSFSSMANSSRRQS